jgi:hypothetical protein
MATGRITVANLVPGTHVQYNIGGVGSGNTIQASGGLGSPTSGTFQQTWPVSGYELYFVQFWNVGYPAGSGTVLVDNISVEGDGDPTQVSLAVEIT